VPEHATSEVASTPSEKEPATPVERALPAAEPAKVESAEPVPVDPTPVEPTPAEPTPAEVAPAAAEPETATEPIADEPATEHITPPLDGAQMRCTHSTATTNAKCYFEAWYCVRLCRGPSAAYVGAGTGGGSAARVGGRAGPRRARGPLHRAVAAHVVALGVGDATRGAGGDHHRGHGAGGER